MKNLILSLLFLMTLSSVSFATLNPGYVPCVKTSGPPAQVQNCDIFDTGNPNVVGNVGINSLSPGAQLDVNGTIRALYFQGVASGPVNSVQFNNAGNLGGSANFVWDGQNVGIGTSSPSYNLAKLAVQDNTNGGYNAIYASESGSGGDAVSAIANNTNGIAVYGFSNGTSAIGVEGSTTATTGMAVYANGSNGYGVYSNAGINYFHGNVGIGTITVPDAMEFTANKGIGDPGNFYINAQGTLALQANGVGGITLDDNGTQTIIQAGLLQLQASGNIGIGSSSPGQGLDVGGTLRIREHILSGQTSGTLKCVKSDGTDGYCSGSITGVVCSTCN